MVAPAIMGLASGALSALGEAAQAAPATSGVSGTNQGFQINPIGINLGTILQPYQDSPYNGGYGLRLPSRLDNLTTPAVVSSGPYGSTSIGGGLSTTMLLILGAVAIGGVLLLKGGG